MTVVAYVAIGVAWYGYAGSTIDDYWDVSRAAGVVVWAGLAVGLLLRWPGAWLLLVASDYVSITAWLEHPHEWLLFAGQLLLLSLLLSPAIERYLRFGRASRALVWLFRDRRPRSRLADVLWLSIGIAGLGAGAIVAARGEPVALPIFALAVYWLLLPRRIDSVLVGVGLVSDRHKPSCEGSAACAERT